jgi:hypothetical protein
LIMALAALLALIPPYRSMLIELLGFPLAAPTTAPAAPTPNVASGSQPTPVTTPPPAVTQTDQHQVCGRWQSDGSEKTYDFICRDRVTFQLRQINGAGGENSGSGTFTADGQVHAQILIARNNRTAYLKLRLSGDGQRLDGFWSGSAAIETGAVSFRRIEP